MRVSASFDLLGEKRIVLSVDRKAATSSVSTYERKTERLSDIVRMRRENSAACKVEHEAHRA